ncbi:hypothetical protein Smp_082580 [Schistosoma mansoni]|uniref:hypothetical protein n=1 Tax=Schistosoma mansoni TaxID=6183 RepID=UPI0001A624EF|nr:hypothetical protein Smp_082580 [Schistosoma mansoni]|eukprot:XP_018647289.1 hypothetical protein Smp_082580 [Schistosoma mansoni]
MGTFLGHIYPGLFIALIALRNLWIELRSFYTEEYNHNQLKSKNDLKNNLRESIFYINYQRDKLHEIDINFISITHTLESELSACEIMYKILVMIPHNLTILITQSTQRKLL